MTLTKTRIEWVKNLDGSQGFTLNPIKGLCPVDCKDNQGKSYCYARRMYKRFGWNPEIRFDRKPLDQLAKIKTPSRIFIGSTMELFGDWIKWWWFKTILDFCLLCPQHIFIFLTKNPKGLLAWSPFPSNCWVGVSAVDDAHQIEALSWLSLIETKVKFLSLEPLLGEVILPYGGLKEVISWIIIGQSTPISASTTPRIEWIADIVEACDKAGIPIFLKNNLYPLLGLGDGKSLLHNNENGTLRQEFPYAQNTNQENI